MKRRDFIRMTSLASSGVLMSMNGIKLTAMSDDNFMKDLAKSSTNDKVLVMVQLHGGNDGLNMVIPINHYSEYYNLRPNIAIPQTGTRKYITLDPSLPTNKQIGIHPDMTAAKAMYDQGRMAVIQNVSYANANGSHFRGRDILFMGGNYNDYFSSGWMGRYLDYHYPGYPEEYPNPLNPDPLAIEIGTGVSLAFHRNEGIPMGLSVENPNAFYNLINSVGVDEPLNIPPTHAGDEIEYMMQIERQSNRYAERLRDVYNAGTNSSVVYPENYPYIAPANAIKNQLAPQLKIVSRLLSGGVGTKIFLCRIGGFDLHANQVQNNDTSMGAHAALLYHISSAMKAFYDDLANLGLADRVLSMTFSEFGRRAASNASYGTDHGNAAPMLVFGTCINGGVYGENPDLGNLVGNNVPMQYDYRQVYSSVIKDWFGASEDAVEYVRFQNFMDARIDYVQCKELNIAPLFKENVWMKCYPNPTSGVSTISFYMREEANVKVEIKDVMGRQLFMKNIGSAIPGEYSIDYDFSKHNVGMYLVTLIINDQSTVSQKVIFSK